MAKPENDKVAEILLKFRSHKIIVVAVVFATIIVSVAAFTDALTKIHQFAGDLIQPRAFSVSGEIIAEPGSSAPVNMAVMIYWQKDDWCRDCVPGYQSSRIWKPDPNKGALDFLIEFPNPPPEIAMLKLEDISLAIGIIVVFSDDNGNGIRDKDEDAVAFCEDYVVTYLEGDIREFIKCTNEKAENPRRRIDTLQDIREGYSISGVIPPEERGLKSGFDDLVSEMGEVRITIVLRRDGSKGRFPNWT